MLIKKSFINGKIIFGNGEVILPLKNIDNVCAETKSHLIKIYWSRSKKVEAPKILYTKKGNFSKPVYITTHGGIFKIGNVMSTQFQYVLKYIVGTDIVFNGTTYSSSELEDIVTKINTILFLTSPMLVTTNLFSNVTEEISS